MSVIMGWWGSMSYSHSFTRAAVDQWRLAARPTTVGPPTWVMTSTEERAAMSAISRQARMPPARAASGSNTRAASRRASSAYMRGE